MRYQKYTVDDVRKAASRKRFTVISCFAGGGGSSIGYRLAGGNVLLINEFVQSAIDTYSANFPETPVLVEDIKDLTAEDFLSKANLKKGELDVMDGSPPCSAFSINGKREKGWGQDKVYSEGKIQNSIEDLFLEYIRIIEGVRPKVIVAENVKAITYGKSDAKKREFVRAFENLGYSMVCKVLNGADFGVPQKRERAIFVGVRDDVLEKTNWQWINMNMVFPSPTTPKHITVGDALGDVVNDETEVKMLLEFVEGSWQKRFIEMLPKNPKKVLQPDMPQFRDVNPKGSCFNMKRCSQYLPSPTLTQSGQAMNLSGVVHFNENRKLTIEECKRIMSFPDDYVLTGTFNQQAERLGRAVAPRMYEQLMNSIYDHILKEYNNA
jgi:DNA (cytosine-5)-methyltransferase 1